MADQLRTLPKNAKVIYEHCLKQIPNSLSQQDLVEAIGASISVNDLSSALNILLSRRLLDPLRQGNVLVYRAVRLDEAKT